MTRRSLWLLILACSLVSTVAPPAAYAEVIARGREADVLDLFKPFRDEGTVTTGITLAGVRISAQKVVVTLRRAASGGKATAEATVILTPVAPVTAGKPHFSVRLASTDEADLQSAQKAIAAAISRNDKGTFFAPPPVEDPAEPGAGGDLSDGQPVRSHAHQRATTAAPVTSLTVSPEAWLGGILWLVLLVIMAGPLFSVFARVLRGPHRLVAMAQLGAGVTLLLLALRSRLDMPFVPLHANQHGWEDLAVLLNLPDAAPAVGRHLEVYGAAWLVARRALLPLFGAHFDGVGLAGAWWGATAVLLAAVAALRAGGSRVVVGVAAVALVYAPVAARVAHSESDLVVGQWLIAAGLWLATREGRLAVGGVCAAIALLALGHVVGPPLGLALALMAIALRPALPEEDSTPPTVRALPSSAAGDTTPLAGMLGAGVGRDLSPRLWTAAGFGLTLVAATAIRLLSAGVHLGSRLGITEQAVPIPLQPWKFSLWLSTDYASTGLGVLALLGVVGALAVRWADARWRGVVVELPLWMGVAAVVTTGLVVCASLTDGLRYQSLLAAPMLVLAGRAGLAWRHGPSRWRWALGLACVIALMATLVETGRGFQGRTQLDSQGQQWLHLRATLGKHQGKLYLLRPEWSPGRAAVFEVPQGRWSADGPESLELDSAAATIDCRRGGQLPPQTFAIRFAACSASRNDHQAAFGRRKRPGRPPCASALALRVNDQPLGAWPITVARPLMRLGLPGEFLTFAKPQVPWQLFEAQCRSSKPARRAAPKPRAGD